LYDFGSAGVAVMEKERRGEQARVRRVADGGN